jgi:ATP-dependent DNA helicase RecG
LAYLKGVGPQRAELLAQELELHTYGDLLFYFPFRYFDRTEIVKIASINASTEYVQLAGTLININEEGEGRKKRLVATLYDETGRIDLLWFQGAQWMKRTLRDHEKYVVYGKVSNFQGYFNMAHPEIDLISGDNFTTGLQPVYSTTQKLNQKNITNRSFAKITAALMEKIKPSEIPEILPDGILKANRLCNRFTAITQLHFPDNYELEAAARYRMKWEELFLSQLSIARLKLQHGHQSGWVFDKVGHFFNDFYAKHLPFQLTEAQKRVLREIRADTRTGKQMNRLLQGDVGSGKTIVAVMAMLLALDNGFQACLMAPTEILAQQHFFSIVQLLHEMDIPVKLLTGSVKSMERKAVLASLAEGSLPIIVGTHALIEDSVQFQNLGLAIIDEQHRFGVGQRARLWKKNATPPHILVMTATPIPRTLGMTLYGDLDISVIDQLPPGRQPIKTVHRKDMYRAKVMDFIRSEISKGRQAYIVYPLIEESEKLDYESLLAGYEQVKMWFDETRYKIAMVHGRQDALERENNMNRFMKGEANILVATTVIEVGVNVPNASVMLVESAERFGLSQLHQLRGRVGRGAEQSYCILMTGNKISDESYKRMNILVSSTDGFKIAEEDLNMRGPGDLNGTRQSGSLKFKLADIVKDGEILVAARHAAKELMEQDPTLTHPQNRFLREELTIMAKEKHWGKIS